MVNNLPICVQYFNQSVCRNIFIFLLYQHFRVNYLFKGSVSQIPKRQTKIFILIIIMFVHNERK